MHQVSYYVQTKPHQSLTFMLHLHIYLKRTIISDNKTAVFSCQVSAGIKATMEGPAVAAERKRKKKKKVQTLPQPRVAGSGHS